MAAASVGQIGLDLVVNQNQFSKQMQGITGLAKKAGLALAGAFAIKKLVDFGKSCLDLGSDLAEVQNVVDVTFPSMSSKVDEFAKSAAGSFGLSETMAKKFTGTFGAMSKAFGFSESAAYDMGTTLTGLAGDVASFYNLSQDEAYTKLKSVFTGETESLKDLGVVMTQSALDQYALANGFGKTTSAMSEAEKVALRYQFVQSQLATATGDFARTSGGWANQVRILSLQFDSFKATIGQGLINLFTPIIKVINTLMGKLGTLANAFKSFTELITGNKSSAGSGAAPVSDLADMADTATGRLDNASGAADGLQNSTQGVGKAAKKAAKDMKALMGFDQVNKISSPDDSGDSDTPDTGIGAGASAGGALGSPVDYGELAKGETVVDEAESKFQGLIDRCKELAGLFKTGFTIGFGDSEKRITSIKTHIDGIGQSLKNIFTDSSVISSFNNMLNEMALGLGKQVGAIASIGTTMVENLLGGVDKYLSQNSGFIKTKLVNIFDARAELEKVTGDLCAAVADIFTVFSNDDAKQITADIISVFSNGFLTAVELSEKLGRDIVKTIAGPIIENKDKIKLALENTLAPLRTMADSIAELFTNTYTKISEVYDTYLEPSFTKIKDGLSSILKTILDTYNTYIAPVLQNLADKFSNLVSQHIQPMVDSFLECFGKIAKAVSTTWEETIAPFINKIIEKVGPVVAPIFEDLGTKIMDAFGKIADIVKGILEKLGAFADWCSNNQGAITTITAIIAGFFATWKIVELISFVQQSGGVVSCLSNMGKSFSDTTLKLGAHIVEFGKATAAKVADKIETMALTAMYAKDFVMSLASGTAALVKQAAQFVVNTAAKIADTVAQVAMTVATTAWNLVCGLATVATTALGAAFAFLTSPIGLVILAITAVIAAGVLVYKNWDVVKAKAIEIWGAIKDWFGSTIDTIKAFFTGLWTGIKETFANVGNWFKEKFTAAKDGIHGAFSSIGSWFGDRWKDVSDAFSKTSQWFGTKFSDAYSNVKSAFKNSGNFFGGVWDGITGAFGNITDWFKDKFSTAWQAVKDVFSSGGQIFDGIKDGILDGLKAVINGLIGGINSVISVPFNGINWALDGIRNVDIAGFTPFSWLPSISTPQIPYLAQGGFVKANTPQLAMIGDNKHQGEVVAPENKLREMAMDAVRQAGGGSGISKAELEAILDKVVMRLAAAMAAMSFNIDSEEIAKADLRGQVGIDRRFNNVRLT